MCASADFSATVVNRSLEVLGVHFELLGAASSSTVSPVTADEPVVVWSLAAGDSAAVGGSFVSQTS